MISVITAASMRGVVRRVSIGCRWGCDFGLECEDDDRAREDGGGDLDDWLVGRWVPSGLEWAVSWSLEKVPYVTSGWMLTFFECGSMSIRREKSRATSCGNSIQSVAVESS